jgi:hypothetical protein
LLDVLLSYLVPECSFLDRAERQPVSKRKLAITAAVWATCSALNYARIVQLSHDQPYPNDMSQRFKVIVTIGGPVSYVLGFGTIAYLVILDKYNLWPLHEKVAARLACRS